MQWEEEMCIVHGDNRSAGEKPPKTVVELWCRARSGHSVTLLVQGLRPYLVVAQPGRPQPADQAQAAVEFLGSMDEVVEITPLGDLWTDKGEKPHWKVEVTQPYTVPRLRKRIRDMWDVTSADILFVQRLLLDCDLGPHILARGEVLWAGERAPAETQNETTGDRTTAAGRIAEVGGSGLYPTDLVLSCSLEDLSKAEPFRTPFVTFSFDLETSIQSNRIPVSYTHLTLPTIYSV